MLEFLSKSALRNLGALVVGSSVVLLAACGDRETLPAVELGSTGVEAPLYRIGPGDSLTLFVWRNPELSTTVSVRPDGRISVPLINDLQASGKTPSELADDVEEELGVFIQDPFVTVIMAGFVGEFDQQVRVVGEATNPAAILFRADMTLLDVMIAVGGLTEFAAGNSATLVRVVEGQQKEFGLELDRLIRDGDVGANVALLPGDVIIIPESFL